MTNRLTKTLIGRFVDATVKDQAVAREMLGQYPQLLNARWWSSESVLHFLAIEGFTDAVKFMAESGADVNEKDDNGHTPLIDVALLGNDEVAAVLLKHGADPNAQSDAFDNVLHAAVPSGNPRLVELLLSHGAKADYRTDLGESIRDALPRKKVLREQIVNVLKRHGVKV